MNYLRLIVTAVFIAMPSIGRGAAGDVSFRIPDRAWHVDQHGLSLSLDLFVDVESQASVPAIGWAAVVIITPQPGATGTVEFDPPVIVGNVPNLSPASTSAFLDFDLDESGKAYGETPASPGELNTFSAYVEPTIAPPPTVDSNGNLTLPDGSGLVSLPIALSAGASGSFLISFDPNPRVTGVVYATGLAEPDDIAVHPVGTHTAGLLSIVGLPGDYNTDGVVNLADYAVWRDSRGATGTALLADGSGNEVVDQADYTIWKNNFGQTAGAGSMRFAAVPEPATWYILVVVFGIRFITKRPRSICSVVVRLAMP